MPPVAATLADRLTEDDASALRRLIERSPECLYGRSGERCLPIVLTGHQLQAHSTTYGLVPWLESAEVRPAPASTSTWDRNLVWRPNSARSRRKSHRGSSR